MPLLGQVSVILPPEAVLVRLDDRPARWPWQVGW